MTEEAKAIIIGAGVVGLAIAATSGYKGTYVLEKNSSFGLETSSHNSEVIHAGIYYPKDSLKAKLCLEGRQYLHGFFQLNNVAHRNTGKIIVAIEEAELPALEELFKRAQENGVDDVVMISKRELKLLEPNINGIAGIFSPSTGVIDSYSFMQQLLRKAKDFGTSFVFNCEVVGIEFLGNGYKVYIKEGNNISCVFTRIVINCAGLHAEKIAQLAGIDTESAGYKTYFLKGDYFLINPSKWGRVKRLIYPVPKKHGLGIHNCISADGREMLGPDEYLVDVIDYKVDETKRDLFYRAAVRYFPFLEPEDLTPETSGIRPVLAKGFNCGMPNDFVIVHEAQRGLPGLINLIGIESPGLTASLAIGKYVRDLLLRDLIRYI